MSTYSENKILLGSFLADVSEWMRDECKCNDTDTKHGISNTIHSRYGGILTSMIGSLTMSSYCLTTLYSDDIDLFFIHSMLY